MQSARKVGNFKKFMANSGLIKPTTPPPLGPDDAVVPLFEKINSIITSAITEQTEPKEESIPVKQEETLPKEEPITPKQDVHLLTMSR